MLKLLGRLASLANYTSVFSLNVQQLLPALTSLDLSYNYIERLENLTVSYRQESHNPYISRCPLPTQLILASEMSSVVKPNFCILH